MALSSSLRFPFGSSYRYHPPVHPLLASTLLVRLCTNARDIIHRKSVNFLLDSVISGGSSGCLDQLSQPLLSHSFFQDSSLIGRYLHAAVSTLKKSLIKPAGQRKHSRHLLMASDSDNTQEILSQTPWLGGTLQRAIQVSAFEGPKKYLANTTLVADKQKPRPGPGEVLVRMRLRPVNPADVLSLMGLYPGFHPTQFPATPGLEGMGVVDKLGLGVTGFKVGQRVVPLLGAYTKAGQGSWQEYCCVAADDLLLVPDAMSDEAAAQMIVNPVTALGMLRDLAPPPGAYILQSAAGSALGRFVIALGPLWGFRTINIVRRAGQGEELRALGADEVICSAQEDVVERVKEITGGQLAWAGIDSVAGPGSRAVAAAVRQSVTVLVAGGLSSPDSTVAVFDLIFRDVTLKGWWLSRYLESRSPEERKALLSDVVKLFEQGAFRPHSGEKMDLVDFRTALQREREEGRPGKVLLTG